MPHITHNLEYLLHVELIFNLELCTMHLDWVTIGLVVHDDFVVALEVYFSSKY